MNLPQPVNSNMTAEFRIGGAVIPAEQGDQRRQKSDATSSVHYFDSFSRM